MRIGDKKNNFSCSPQPCASPGVGAVYGSLSLEKGIAFSYVSTEATLSDS
jgi:hypothetical protein